MKNKAQMSGMMTTILVTVIVGVIAAAIVATQIASQTSSTTITDDQFVMSNTTCVDLTDNCITSITSIENSTSVETIGSGNYTLCRVSAPVTRFDGVLVSGDTSIDAYNGDTKNATYVETACNSLQGGLVRTIAPFFVVLMAVILLMFVASWIK